MDCTDTFHEIIMKESVEFQDIDDDFLYLFRSFSLLSWITHDCQVNISDMIDQNGMVKYTFSHKPILIDKMQCNLYQFNKNQENFTIEYYFEPDTKKFTKAYPLKASFHKAQVSGQDVIAVRIQDPTKILKQTFIPPMKEKLQHKRDALKQKQIIYYYIEPNSIRNQQCNQRHFSLAFQGGGAKGIAYIGAYKAVRETYPNTRLKTVIGSSAGGMLALAMCTGAKLDQIVKIVSQMDKIPKDKLIQSQEDLTQEKKKFYKDIVSQIRDFLHDYGIIHNKIFDIIRNEILTEDFIEQLFSYLFADNDSLKQMFTIPVPHPRIEGFHKSQMTNYYGILQAKLMRGNEILQISIKMLVGFLKSLFIANPKLFFEEIKQEQKQITEQKYVQIAEKLTMSQFYRLTDKTQFTCTAVDIDSHVLRFFNHKTTPHLPVVKAVQMTGSFPVAFEALKWKKQWGKYYIHYQRHRKQIDLTGHQFTDGGMLANFPIKYLDNEKMRPMYFAHKKNQFTTLFGFGLREMQQTNNKSDQELEAQLKIKIDKFDQLIKKLKSNVSYPKLALAFVQVPLKTQVVDPQNLTKPRKIPIVDFLLKLLQTYQNSNDNLVRQCFQYQTFLFNQKLTKIQSLNSEKIDWLIDRYSKLIHIIEQMKMAITSHDYSVKKSVQYYDNLKKVLSQGSVSATTLWNIKWTIKKAIINFSKYIKQNMLIINENQNKLYQDQINYLQRQHQNMLTQLQLIGVIQVFSKSNKFQSDASRLIFIIDKMSEMYLGKNREPLLQFEINRDLQNFFLYRKRKQLLRLERIDKIAKAYYDKLKSARSTQQNMPDMDPKLVKLIIQFMQKIGNPEMIAFKEFQKKLQQLRFKTFQIRKYLEDIKESIQYYVNWVFVNSKSNDSDLHLVFQGLGVSMSYYYKAYILVEDMIFQTQSRKTRELSFSIAKDILHSSKRIGNSELLTKQTDLKYTLLKYVQCNLQDLQKQEQFQLDDNLKLIPDKDLKKRISKEIKKRSTRKISSITCSNYHSILGFFIAVGFKQDRIQKQLMGVKYCIGVKQNIQKIFKSKDWTIPEKCTIRSLQDRIWEGRYNLFKALENACSDDKMLTKQLQTIKNQFQNCKELVIDGFQEVMDYVISAEIRSKKQKNPAQYLAKVLSLKYKDKNYLLENKKLSEGTQELIYHLLDFFKEEIKFMIMSIYQEEPLIDLVLTENDPKKLEIMWKGLIIGGFYEADKLKLKIQNILEEINFPKNMTLREFYEASPRKIKLNFMAVDMRSQRIFFINHYSFPYMPVWAAIMITTSFPGFFPQIRCQPQWIQKISVSSRERTIKSFFAQKIPQYMPSFVSGNLLASFPLELLTNREVQSRYLGGQNRETFLNFGILRLKRQTSLRKFRRSYISLDDIIMFGFKLLMKFVLGYKLIPSFSIAAIDDKIKILTTFINSHDNLIQDLYQNNTLMLPVRLGTLDFHKINQPLLLQMAIEQSCYITIQKLSLEKGTYFRLDLNDSILNLKFFSRGKNQTSLYNRTNLSYKFSQKQQFVLLTDENIDLDPFEDEIWIQFFYVNDKKHIKQSIYRLNYAQIVRKCLVFSGIFYLAYDAVMNTNLEPLQEPISTPKDIRNDGKLFLGIKSVVSFDQQGLYCIECCADLNRYPQKDFDKLYNRKLNNGLCYNCGQIYLIRFTCLCSARYCTMCTRDKLVIRKKSTLRCLRGHILDFFSKHEVSYRPRTFKFTLCDFCTQYTEAYYQDVKCNIHICQMCCAQLIQK